MKHVTRNTNRNRRSATKGRRAARVRFGLVLTCALGFLLAGVAVFHEVGPWKSASDGVAVAIPLINDPYPEGDGGGGPNPDPVSIPYAQPGAPRPWESSTAVSLLWVTRSTSTKAWPTSFRVVRFPHANRIFAWRRLFAAKPEIVLRRVAESA